MLKTKVGKSIAIAVPLALIATLLPVWLHIPRQVRYVFSPGFRLGWATQGGPSDLDAFTAVGFGANFIFYFLLVYGVISIIRAFRMPPGDSGRE
jgi:hypothetical protein